MTKPVDGAEALAPKHIWLLGYGTDHGDVSWCDDPNPTGEPDVDGDSVGYVKASLHAALVADARLAGVKEGLEMAASGERPDDDLLEPHLPERIKSEKRCGIQQSDWLPGWYVPWSPRNDNQNAEGPWSHWVALAHEILAADQAAIRAIPVKADDRERA